MARKKKKNHKYPGVSVFKDGTGNWYMKWTDPNTLKRKERSLRKEGYDSLEQADDYLRRFCDNLQEEITRARIVGRRERYDTSWCEATKLYLDHYKSTNGEASAGRQQRALYVLTEWLGSEGKRYRVTGDLNRLGLVSIHDFIARLRKRVPVGKPEGGAPGVGDDAADNHRGRNVVSDAPLSGASKNSYRAAIIAFLNWIRRREYLRVTSDDVRDAMPKFRQERKLPVEVSAETLQGLIAAAVDHDTNWNHASRADKHAYYTKQRSETATAKYKPLFPLVAMLMLTGMRLGEALHLRWENVDIEAKRIRVKADRQTNWQVKTRHERNIGFSDSPALERLLTGMKMRRGLSPYVLPDCDGPSPRKFNRASWNLMLESAGVPKVTPKELRSTYATALASARNAPTPYQLAFRMGHGVAVAAGHYVADTQAREGNSVEQWLQVEKELVKALDELGFPHCIKASEVQQNG